MRRLDALTLGGIASLLIGGFGVWSAGRPVHVFGIGACAIVLTLALLVTTAFWRALFRHGGEATGAVLVSWLGVGPGIALLVGLTQPPDAARLLLPPSLIDLLWYGCGPMMFAVSAALSPPRESPAALNFVRTGHLAAWIGAATFAACAG